MVTAPTGGSAGVIPAVLYALGEGGRKLPQQKIRDGLLAAAVVGYLGKHNATLAAAEGCCQAEIGIASGMGTAFIAAAFDAPPQVIANAAESSIEHHLDMTCDPVLGTGRLALGLRAAPPGCWPRDHPEEIRTRGQGCN